MKKRLFALLSCLALLLTLLPARLAPEAKAVTVTGQSTAITAEQTLQERRQAVFDYMMSMATVMWRATEDVTYTYGTSTAPIKAGRLYRGIPYTYGRGDLATFLDFAGEPDENGVVEISGLTTQHLDGSGRHARIGNDCSGAVNAAYGSIGASVNICGASTTVPSQGYLRVGYDKYTTKPSDSTNSNGKDVCAANGEQVMYSIYAEAQLADIWACSGHDMLHHYSKIVYNEDGTINGEQSIAYIVHQTPAPIRNESYYTSGTYAEANYGEKVYKTYEIDVTRTFKWLYDNGYMPVNCAELVDASVVPAEVTLEDTVSDHSFATITQGILTSNRMIDSVTLTITDTEGAVLQQATAYPNRYTERTTNAPLAFDMFRFEYENPEKQKGFVNLKQLGVGDYHCTTTARLRTGEILTARDFDFSVTEEDLCAGWVDNRNLISENSLCPVCKVEVQWQPLTAISATTNLNGGHYYLTEDIDNTAYYNMQSGTNCIHLNGHNMNSSTLAIRIGNATLNMMGNGKVTGSFNDPTAKYGSTIYLQNTKAKLNLYGGTYGHNNTTSTATIGMFLPTAYVAMYGGATICRMNGATGPNVYVGKGIFEMFGGLITDGDNRKNYGGNIKVGDDADATATFIQHDGIIAYGKAKHGGNIHIDGPKSTFIQNGGLIYLGMAGYITNDGLGGNLYMDLGGTAQLDGTMVYGKAYANAGNVYAKSGTVSVGGTVAYGNGDYGSAGGKFAGNIWIGNNTQLTITGTVRDPIGSHAYGGNISASASDIFIDGGTVSGGTSTSRGGNIYMTATGSSLTIKNGGKLLNGNSKDGGNFATNGTNAELFLIDGLISGGTATTGPELRFHSSATLYASGGKIEGSSYLYTGNLELGGNAEGGNITFTTGKLTVEENWSGTASAKWKTAYTVGNTISEGAATGPYTGKLYLLNTENRIVANADNTLLVKGPSYTVTFCDEDGSLISSAEYFAGETVTLPEAPTKAEDENYTYEFAGWTPEIVAVSGNAEYTATYDATAKPTEPAPTEPEPTEPSEPAVENAIVKQPENITVDSGNDVQFSVVAQGEVVSYKWEYRKLYKWFNTSMTGYNTDTLTVAATGQRNGYDYRCTVTFADGTVIVSEPAELTVKTYMNVTYHPNDQVVVLGYKGQFTAEGQGEGLKYQWQYCRPGSEKWIDTAMEGATKATVMIETTTARDGYMYRCKITDVTGNEMFTEVATMRVLSFTSHPVETFAPTSGTVQFTVSASVEEGFTYQWQYRRNATANWTNTTMTGYNTATLTVVAKGKNGYEYRCVLTGSKNSKIESKGAVLHVSDPVVINAQPTDLTVTADDNAVFHVEATNVYSYQWKYNKTGTTWSKTSAEGNQTATLTVPAKGKNGYKYRCEMKGLDGQTYITDEVTLTVG